MNFVAVGIHTGTIILFDVTSDTKSFVCSIADSQRCHVQAITDLASASTIADDAKEVISIVLEWRGRGCRGAEGPGTRVAMV